MNSLLQPLARSGLLKKHLDYHLLRTAMVVIFAWFGYDKSFPSEIAALAPLIEHGPLIFWTIPVLGIHGTAILLGAAEWTFGSLLLGFWNKKLGVLGAIGSIATFISTLTILPFVPDGWDAGAGGFPAMAMNAAFLLKGPGVAGGFGLSAQGRRDPRTEPSTERLTRIHSKVQQNGRRSRLPSQSAQNPEPACPSPLIDPRLTLA